jgi:type IV secretory pathway VirB3-like protein
MIIEIIIIYIVIDCILITIVIICYNMIIDSILLLFHILR